MRPPTGDVSTVLAARGAPRTSSAPRAPAAAWSLAGAALAPERRMRFCLCLGRRCDAASRHGVSAPTMTSASRARSACVSGGPRARSAACQAAALPLRLCEAHLVVGVVGGRGRLCRRSGGEPGPSGTCWHVVFALARLRSSALYPAPRVCQRRAKEFFSPRKKPFPVQTVCCVVSTAGYVRDRVPVSL